MSKSLPAPKTFAPSREDVSTFPFEPILSNLKQRLTWSLNWQVLSNLAFFFGDPGALRARPIRMTDLPNCRSPLPSRAQPSPRSCATTASTTP